MKTSNIFSLFLLMAAIISIFSFSERFNDIENVFSMLFWYFIAVLILLAALTHFISSNKDKEE